MTSRELYKETNKQYSPVKQLSWGFECFNKTYKRNVVLRSENELDRLVKLVKNGWQIVPGNGKWLLRSPEISLYDLSEVHRNPSFDPIEIFAYYLYLQNHNLLQIINKTLKSNRQEDLAVRYLKSKNYFEACCRLAGSDKRVKNLPILLLREIKKEKDWKKFVKQSKNLMKPRDFLVFTKGFSQCSQKTQSFLSDILNKYKIIGRNISPPEKRVYSGFWKKLDKYCACIFVPTGGFPFLCGYAEESGDYNKIHLWEHHSVVHENKELTWIDKAICSKKRLALIDVVYSGRTIKHINKQLRLQESSVPDLQIDNIGLFPKSRKGFPCLDYVVMLDRFIEVKDLQLKEKDFFAKNFIKIVNNDI